MTAPRAHVLELTNPFLNIVIAKGLPEESTMINFGDCTLSSMDGTPICMGSCHIGEQGQGIMILTISQWAGARRITSRLGKVSCTSGAVYTVEVLCYDEESVELQQIPNDSASPATNGNHGLDASKELTYDVMERLQEMADRPGQRGSPPRSLEG